MVMLSTSVRCLYLTKRFLENPPLETFLSFFRESMSSNTSNAGPSGYNLTAGRMHADGIAILKGMFPSYIHILNRVLREADSTLR